MSVISVTQRKTPHSVVGKNQRLRLVCYLLQDPLEQSPSAEKGGYSRRGPGFKFDPPVRVGPGSLISLRAGPALDRCRNFRARADINSAAFWVGKCKDSLAIPSTANDFSFAGVKL
ncbi:hypothetical protein JTE90_014504 [Oedothorax gibbosus]|uniref:Uncharacterized protein n=1 Tax=Oedothorax gibbosus TaxID=931172 RepID=A0AAV6VM65_9ARAC|nr:hypothetical protein JTE90_014504 [Oedothorax gibbosus]